MFCIGVLVIAYLYIDARDRGASAIAELAESSDKNRQLAAKLAKAERENADLRQQAVRSPQTAAASGGGSKPVPPVTADPAAIERISTARQKSAMNDARFPKLFQRLGLTPKEVEAMKDLMIERQSAMPTVIRKAQREGIPITTEKMQEEIGPLQAEVDQLVQKLVGDARFSVYQDFTQNAGPYALLDRVEQNAQSRGQSLSAEQSNALLKILEENQAAGNRPNSSRTANQFLENAFLIFTLQAQISDDTIARAATTLSPQQLEALRSLQKEQQDLAKVMPSMNAPRPPK